MKRSLNLMSSHASKREQIRSCLQLWLRVFAVVLCVITLAGIMQWRNGQAAHERLASSEAEYEPIRQLSLENIRLRNKIKTLRQDQAFPLALAKHQPLLGLIGLSTQALAEHDEKFYLQQIEITRDPSVSSSSSTPTLFFSLGGVSSDGSSATRLANRLRTSGPFASVDLSINAVTRMGNQSKQNFSIQCTN